MLVCAIGGRILLDLGLDCSDKLDGIRFCNAKGYLELITAPVASFEAFADKNGGRVVGYAAPARGMAPCRILVRNGGEIVAAAAAIDYAGDNCLFRLGWCGFTLPLSTELFALDDRATLVCAISGRILLDLSLDFSDVPDEPEGAAALIPTAVENLAEPFVAYAPVAGIVRLVQAVVARQSVEKGVHALFQMLLARDADEVGMQHYRRKMTTAPGTEQAVRSIMRSDEFGSVPPGRRFHNPYRSVNAIDALLALSEATVADGLATGERRGQTAVIQFRELVTATREFQLKLSDNQKRRADSLAAHTTWGSSTSVSSVAGSEERIAKIAAALLNSPSWWGYMPRRWQRKKLSERLGNLGLCDGPAYLRRYPDVAAAGMDPLLHYLLHGRSEGRTI